MDSLSDILRAIRLNSCVYFRKDFAAPWGMEIGSGEYAQFHLVVRGQCWLNSSPLEKPILLSAGDIVLFLHGAAHWLADAPDSPRMPGRAVVNAVTRQQPLFEGERFATTLICGHFEFDRSLKHPFIQSLPGMIHISNTGQNELSRMETIINHIIREAGSEEPGAEVVANRLAEVLFIQILRNYIRQQAMTGGFLAAFANQQISRALSLIHSRPDDNWTLEKLARSVGMSRANFASKFKQLVGLTPMEYLTRWRMNRARELLQDRGLPLIDIAEQVGYTSQAAFSRAFKRHFGQNPGAWRRIETK